MCGWSLFFFCFFFVFFIFILIIKEVVTTGRPWPDIYDHDIDIYATSNFYYLEHPIKKSRDNVYGK